MTQTTSLPRENLVRALPGARLVRAEGDAMPTLAGHAAVFNQWAEIRSRHEGHFLERIAPGAFAKTINENRDKIKVLYDHGLDPSVGNKPLGPIRILEEDNDGLRYEVPLLDTSYNRELIPALEAGLLGSSFRFSVMKENYVQKPKRSEENPNGLPERTVQELKMAEFGPVTFPAYTGATAGVRSITDEYLFARFLDDPERLEELIAAYKKTRMEPEPPEATTPADIPEAIEPEDNRTKEPELPVATTRPEAHKPVGLYPSNRKEKPSWLL